MSVEIFSFVRLLPGYSFGPIPGRVGSDKVKKFVGRVESGQTPVGRVGSLQWIRLGQCVGSGWVQ